MQIGIIGAGNIGGNLTRRLTGLGHDVSVANSRSPATLADLAAETGATAVDVAHAADGADVVIVAIPLRAVVDLPAGVLDAAKPGAAVIDTGNYYPQQRDGAIAAIEAGATESRWTAEQLGHDVIKVFNNVFAQHLIDRARPAGAGGRLAVPVAGDDAAAKATVLQLVDELGFDPVDAGSLDESWRQQPGSPAYGADTDVDGMRRLLAEASPERPAEFRG